MRLCICTLLLMITAPAWGQEMVRDTDRTALEQALQNYVASIPVQIDDVGPTTLIVINQESGETSISRPKPQYISMEIDGEELTFNYLELSQRTLKAFAHFRYATADCAVLLARKTERYSILHWPEEKWQSSVKRYNHGNSVVGDGSISITCDTVDRAFVVHTLEPLLAVHTEDAWKVYSKPPELFAPDWDMQYFFEQRYEQERDTLMEQYQRRNR